MPRGRHPKATAETKAEAKAETKTKAKARTPTAANLGFEASLWKTADALRGSMDAAEYRHVVLGLI